MRHKKLVATFGLLGALGAAWAITGADATPAPGSTRRDTPAEANAVGTPVLGADGKIAGYAMFPSRVGRKDTKDITYQALIDVVDASGTLVGYMGYGTRFVPLREASAPGFDIEDVRASMYGNCEPRMGDTDNPPPMKYPLCPDDTP